MSTFRKPLLTGTLVLLSAIGMAQVHNVAVNDNGASPDATGKALLDISFSNAAAPKGFLIPRMTQAQRLLIPVGIPAQQGLTVYQTDGTEGFWYYAIAGWTYMNSPSQPWVLTGNFSTNPATNFLGTTNAQPLVFRTGGVNERMRIDAAGNVGINQGVPSEKLDVTGAILFTGTSATNTAGAIRWNSGVNYHEGNQTGALAGWTKLENDYLETFGATYDQQGLVGCNQTSAIIGPWTAMPPAPAPTSNGKDVTLWPYAGSGTIFQFRHQWLIRRNELSVELNQMAGNTNATMGICPNISQITGVDFYITSPPPLNPDVNTMTYNIRIRHSALSSLTDFDPTSDPLSVCTSAAAQAQPAAPGANGWKSFAFATPFVWNGVDNVIVEFCGRINTPGWGTGVDLTLWATPNVGYACNYSRMGDTFGAPPCVLTGPATCASVPGCGMTNACGAASGVNTNVRPVMRFTGTNLGLAPAATLNATTGKYINFNGGFMVEVNGSNWAANLGPPKSFKGIGRISAESGVWDDQVKLNDHVFDRYFDGRVAPQDAERHGDQRQYDLGEMANYVERERHLPTMKGRTEWDRTGGFALGDLGNQLWVTTETQALYAAQLNERLDALNALAADQPLTATDVQRVTEMVCAMEGLTEAQKQRLLQDYRSRSVLEQQQR